jgi:hypothetical protein
MHKIRRHANVVEHVHAVLLPSRCHKSVVATETEDDRQNRPAVILTAAEALAG